MTKLDYFLRERINDVALTARRHGDSAIAHWADRAVQDALALGKVRDRDLANLKRLEDTYSHDYYSGGSAAPTANPVYA